MNPQTIVYLEEGASIQMDTVQIRGIDSTKRYTKIVCGKDAEGVVTERLLTHGHQEATSDMEIVLDGENSRGRVISRSVAQDESSQLFYPRMVGNAKCFGHVQCDSIIMGSAKIRSIPEIAANSTDAQLIHEAAIGKIAGDQLLKLQTLGLTAEEARQRLFAEIESRTRHEAAKMMRLIEAEARETADRKAKEIIACSIQRYAGDYVGEHTVTAVTLPSEDMKGRIIGREGRNIRALEAATGVDLIIDDTPETVILSAYSPLRRQVAKMALERLIQDGRIHPARIEDVVHKCEQELEVQIREVGEQATFDAGVHGIHPELVRFLGQLRYRTSFTQNVLQHSLEVSALCGMMAAELGMDIKKAKRAGLLHDIGKAVDHEVEGPHALIGADLAKKYNESKEILHAIAAHHEDQRPETALAVLVQAADSLSGARPGARKELLESYVKRLEDLENIASEFDGVSKAYAIQAGREIRVMVNSENVDDDQTYMLCKGITGKIEENLTYPGQIRVTVIRERRAVGYAK